jgi:protein SCO1/2
MNRTIAATVLGLLLAAAPAALSAGAAPAASTVATLSPLAFQSQAGEPVTLPDGRVWVVTFFYGSCKTACPIVLHNMANVAARMTPEMRTKVGLAAITFDPQVDQPARLRQLAVEHGLADLGVQLLRDEGPALQVAVRHFGFDFAAEPDGGFRHANLMAVMDGHGRVLRHVYGLQPDLDRVLQAVKGAL